MIQTNFTEYYEVDSLRRTASQGREWWDFIEERIRRKRKVEKKNKEQGNKCRGDLAWHVGIGWLGILYFWLNRVFAGTQKLPEFCFVDIATPGQSSSTLDLESYINRPKIAYINMTLPFCCCCFFPRKIRP